MGYDASGNIIGRTFEGKTFNQTGEIVAQSDILSSLLVREERVMANKKIGGILFDVNMAEDIVSRLKNEIKVPYIDAYKSTLGGEENVSILLAISLDEKDTWTYGIYENSRYARFYIDNNGVVEHFRGNIEPRFRKTKVKDVDSLINKLNIYFQSIEKKSYKLADEIDNEEIESEPAPSDYILSDSGSLGEKTSVGSEDYGFLGEFDSEEEALEFIKEHMEKNKVYGDVWYLSDHGNLEMVGLAGIKEKKNGIKMADVWEELFKEDDEEEINLRVPRYAPIGLEEVIETDEGEEVKEKGYVPVHVRKRKFDFGDTVMTSKGKGRVIRVPSGYDMIYTVKLDSGDVEIVNQKNIKMAEIGKEGISNDINFFGDARVSVWVDYFELEYDKEIEKVKLDTAMSFEEKVELGKSVAERIAIGKIEQLTKGGINVSINSLDINIDRIDWVELFWEEKEGSKGIITSYVGMEDVRDIIYEEAKSHAKTMLDGGSDKETIIDTIVDTYPSLGEFTVSRMVDDLTGKVANKEEFKEGDDIELIDDMDILIGREDSVKINRGTKGTVVSTEYDNVEVDIEDFGKAWLDKNEIKKVGSKKAYVYEVNPKYWDVDKLISDLKEKGVQFEVEEIGENRVNLVPKTEHDYYKIYNTHYESGEDYRTIKWKTSRKIAGTELWKTPDNKWWLLSTVSMKKVGPYFNTKEEAIEQAVKVGRWKEEVGKRMLGKEEPDGVGYPEDFEDILKKAKYAQKVGWLRDQWVHTTGKILDALEEFSDMFKAERKEDSGPGMGLFNYYSTSRYEEVEKPLRDGAITKNQAKKLLEDLLYQFKLELYSTYGVKAVSKEEVEIKEEPKEEVEKESGAEEVYSMEDAMYGQENYPPKGTGAGSPDSMFFDIIDKQPMVDREIITREPV